MISRIVAQSDDVVVDAVILHTVEEVRQHAGLRRTLAMQDNLGIRTLLATCLSGLFQQTKETVPVGCRRIGITTVCAVLSNSSLRSPQHTIADLVARLDEVGRSTSSLQLTETLLGIFIDLVCQRSIVQVLPGIRCPLLARVCPGVAIVEVKHESHASLLDALT